MGEDSSNPQIISCLMLSVLFWLEEDWVTLCIMTRLWKWNMYLYFSYYYYPECPLGQGCQPSLQATQQNHFSFLLLSSLQIHTQVSLHLQNCKYEGCMLYNIVLITEFILNSLFYDNNHIFPTDGFQLNYQPVPFSQVLNLSLLT